MAFLIRPIGRDQPGIFRDLRVEALREPPDAFGASYETEAMMPLEFFAGRLAGNTIFGGFRGDELFGTAGFMIEAGLKRDHKGLLWGMYVRPAARGTGLAGDLVRAVIDHARDKVELIHLTVVSDNTSARRLYTSLGFEEYGVEAKSLKVDGRYLDEVMMVKMLD